MDGRDLDRIADDVRPILDARFSARETAITDGRKVIRASANAIRSLHRGETEKARALIDEARSILGAVLEELQDHPDLQYAGFVSDAAKEYAEAELTAAMFGGERLPGPGELGIDPVPFLHGLGETVGECRRRLLDRLRTGDVDAAEELLASMDAVVDLLAALDYPDGMTAGLRRTTDVARSLVERSRADLTATVVQERLRSELAARLD